MSQSILSANSLCNVNGSCLFQQQIVQKSVGNGLQEAKSLKIMNVSENCLQLSEMSCRLDLDRIMF